jgi:hypothetical protein
MPDGRAGPPMCDIAAGNDAGNEAGKDRVARRKPPWATHHRTITSP